jgi:hypothetical protein
VRHNIGGENGGGISEEICGEGEGCEKNGKENCLGMMDLVFVFSFFLSLSFLFLNASFLRLYWTVFSGSSLFPSE